MMHRLFFFSVLWILAAGHVSICIGGEAIPSGHRSALLIGCDQYGDTRLPFVNKSLDVVEQSLRTQGFSVLRRENLNETELKETLEEFAQSAPTNGVALVYFAGLGAHVERLGKWYNLLRPVDAKIESDNDYRSRALNVADWLESVEEQSGARRMIVAIDACWKSPIQPERDNIQGGFREFEPPRSTFVLFASPSGKSLPLPKSAEASPFAKALAKHISLMENSLGAAGQAISQDVGGACFGGEAETGIGPKPTFPVAEELREGQSPGEGYVNSVGMTFRWCPPGRFTMGSREHDEAGTEDRKPVDVTLTQGFWMGEHEVTQREYDAVARRRPPAGFTSHKNAPYWGANESKSVTDFCKKLNDLERKAGRLPPGWEYVCPTEAEWEYACRAGSRSAYCFGDSAEQLGDFGNFADAALKRENPDYYYADSRSDDGVGEALAPVGRYRPNAWGLRDMHGNVAEIVADHLLPELPGGKDPLARAEKNGVTQIRGGAWCSLAKYCESSFRNSFPGRSKENYIGFRVALKRVK